MMPLFLLFHVNDWSQPSFWPSPLSSTNHPATSAVIGNISRATNADANAAGLLLILIVLWIDFFDDAQSSFWPRPLGYTNHPIPSAVIGNISRATDADTDADADAAGLLLILIVMWIDSFDHAFF